MAKAKAKARENRSEGVQVLSYPEAKQRLIDHLIEEGKLRL